MLVYASVTIHYIIYPIIQYLFPLNRRTLCILVLHFETNLTRRAIIGLLVMGFFQTTIIMNRVSAEFQLTSLFAR